MTEKKEAFVSKEDRPDHKITLDRPVSELTVRDLVEILHVGAHPHLPKTHKVWGESEGHLAVRNFSTGQYTKTGEYHKILENKYMADLIKSYQDTFVPKQNLKQEIDIPFGPSHVFGPGPVEGLAQLVTGLTERVGQLADQVSQLAAREQK